MARAAMLEASRIGRERFHVRGTRTVMLADGTRLHMVQHELLIFLGAPLFLIPLLPAGPAGAGTRSAPRARLVESLPGPLPAPGFSIAILWLWHATAAFDLQKLGGAVTLLSGAMAYVAAAAFTIPEPVPAES